jgi:methylated-DNA-[protein]-cysteine S-methyltransferase
MVDMNMRTIVDSPIGGLEIVAIRSGDQVLVDSVSFTDGVPGGPSELDPIAERLRAYFAGDVREFDLPHTIRGTEFQCRVWAAVERIPYGCTISYGQLATSIGAPRDRIRAVAAAVGANPLLILRPCHRVIGANGALTGYAGGVPRKQFLLVHEGVLQPQLVP